MTFLASALVTLALDYEQWDMRTVVPDRFWSSSTDFIGIVIWSPFSRVVFFTSVNTTNMLKNSRFTSFTGDLTASS